MCSDNPHMSPFHKDEEKRDVANDVLKSMKELRERRSCEMTTVRLPNGAIVSTTSAERLKQYEEYAKRKTGYYR
jgi:hypothetical protein